MALTVEIPEIEEGQKQVDVLFVNEEGLVLRKTLNVPRSNGEVNQELFDEIVEDQKRGVEMKIMLGAVELQDRETLDADSNLQNDIPEGFPGT
jgi:hypothetical protein